MPVLQENELTIAPESLGEKNGHQQDPSVQPQDKVGFWSWFLAGLFVLALSIGGASLATLLTRVQASVWEAADQFRWLVLVKGDALQMDEVGRYLKQLPGSRNVTFVSSEEAFQKLQLDPLYLDDLNAFSASDLPASWRVNWDPVALDFSQLDLWIEDTKRIPSVINVAFDRNSVNQVKKFRSFLYQIQLTLSALLLVGIMLTVFLLGRFLFFAVPPQFQAQEFFLLVVVDQIWWSAGAGLVYWLVGPFPWPVWLLGFGVGVMHFVWRSLEHG